jgi:predicted GNAT superfamily acetyltransferase
VAVPAGIQELKHTRPEVAREWRAHTRTAFEHYLFRHYVVIDFVRETTGGTYVLQRGTALLS